jgi:hypothetical protein
MEFVSFGHYWLTPAAKNKSNYSPHHSPVTNDRSIKSLPTTHHPSPHFPISPTPHSPNLPNPTFQYSIIPSFQFFHFSLYFTEKHGKLVRFKINRLLLTTRSFHWDLMNYWVTSESGLS